MIKFNWGTGITVFLGLFLAMAFYFIYFSFQHHNDLVVDDYYEQGANYDDQMMINKRSVRFTDSIKIANTENHLVLTVSPALATMTDSIMAHFYYPSDKRNDYFVAIHDLKQPAFIDKTQLAKGRYTVKFSWKTGADKYMTSNDIYVSK